MKEIDKDINSIIEKYQFTFKELSPNIITESSQFSSFDKLFYEAFPDLSFEHKEKINYISDLLYIAVMTTDQLIDDNHEKFRQELIFFSKLLWEKAQFKLQQLFPEEHSFWAYYEKYNIDFVTSCLRENKTHFNVISEYTSDEFRAISAGKAAIAKIPIAAICLLTEQVKLIPSFESSIDHYFIGLQVKDDLVDWRIDWKNRRFSFLLTNLIYLKEWEDKLDEIEDEDVGRVIFFANYAFVYLEGAYRSYQSSLEALAEINCPDWKNFIEQCSKDIRNLQVHIRDTVDKEIEKIELDI